MAAPPSNKIKKSRQGYSFSSTPSALALVLSVPSAPNALPPTCPRGSLRPPGLRGDSPSTHSPLPPSLRAPLGPSVPPWFSLRGVAPAPSMGPASAAEMRRNDRLPPGPAQSLCSPRCAPCGLALAALEGAAARGLGPRGLAGFQAPRCHFLPV